MYDDKIESSTRTVYLQSPYYNFIPGIVIYLSKINSVYIILVLCCFVLLFISSFFCQSTVSLACWHSEDRLQHQNLPGIQAKGNRKICLRSWLLHVLLKKKKKKS